MMPLQFTSYSYAISSANTWGKNNLSFCSRYNWSAITDDNGPGVQAKFVLSAGSNYTGEHK